MDEFSGQFLGDLRGIVFVGNREVVPDFSAALLSHLGRAFREIRVLCQFEFFRIIQVPIFFGC